MISLREGIGEEHELCDRGQNIFILLFLIVWLVDSFLFRWSTFLMGSFNWLIRGSIALICLIAGIYLVQGAHKAVFDEAPSDPQVIIWGVFSFVRHPMYLGILLIYLGFVLGSFSILSFVTLVLIFFVYNYLAIFEEKDLERLFGGEYLEYKKRVSRWTPLFWK